MSGARFLFIYLFLVTNGTQLYLSDLLPKSESSEVICSRLHKAAGDEPTAKEAWYSSSDPKASFLRWYHVSLCAYVFYQ